MQRGALLPPQAAPIANELQTTMFPMFNLHPARCFHNLNIGHNYSTGICSPLTELTVAEVGRPFAPSIYSLNHFPATDGYSLPNIQ